jgi:Mn2+/Fe2+ NRAMP family transporter
MNTEAENTEGDNIGSIAEALFILGLLFIGFGYFALLVLYFLKNKSASDVSKNHLKQTLIAASISLFIAIVFITFILMTAGFASATALIIIEVYLMIIIPLFMFFGVMGFSKAVNHKDYAFPIIGKKLGITTTS